MRAEDRDLAYLAAMVDQAPADVRVESVTPALVGMIVGCLPVVLLLVAVLLRPLLGG